MLQGKLRTLDEIAKAMHDEDNIQHIHPSQLIDYHKHKYPKYDTQKYLNLVESVRTFGIIQPIIVRRCNDKYEILAGHNRRRAGAEAGILIPAIVIEADDALADDIVNATNLWQRGFEELTISQQAEILEEHICSLKKRGKMSQWIQDVEDGAEGFTRDLVAKEYGLSGRSISRKLRINKLIPDFKEMVDCKKLSFNVAMELSYLKETSQMNVYDVAIENSIKIKGHAIRKMRKIEESGELNLATIWQILEDKPEIDISGMTREELKEFLTNTTNLPMWFSQRQTKETCRKWDIFEDVSVAVRTYWMEDDEEQEWFLIRPGKSFRSCQTTLDEVVNFLISNPNIQ